MFDKVLDSFNLIEIWIVVLLISYLIGSIPFGMLFAKMLGKQDLRSHGSGNIGATNAMRVGGKKLGILTLIFDMLKGIIAIFASSIFLRYSGVAEIVVPNVFLYASGFSAIFGHIFPIWLRFKGGKGVATSIAVVIFVALPIGLVWILSWIFIYAASRISSLSSIFSVLSSCLICALCYSEDIYLVLMISAVCVLILFRHLENIKRLRTSAEF